jgi:hypothetical protein
MREVIIILDKGQTAWVHTTYKAPRFEVSSTSTTDIDVSARGSGGQDDWDVSTVMFDVLFPDLVFVKDEKGRAIEFSGGSSGGGFDAEVGDVLTIIVNVKNIGDIPAENVDVKLLVDGEEKKVSTLRSVKNGDNGTDQKTVIFSWVAEAGNHRISVVLDPEDTIVEVPGGEGESNEVSRSVDVRGNFLVKQLVNSYPILSTILIMLLAMVILLGVSIVLNRK